MILTKHDTKTLRELGRQVAEIAALPVQRRDHQALEGPQRPEARAADGLHRPGCWHEMDVDGELTLQCDGPLLPRHRDRPAPHPLPLAPHAGRHGGRALGPTCPRSSAARGFGIQHGRRPRRRSTPPTTSSATTTRPDPDRGGHRADPHARGRAWTRRPRRGRGAGPRDIRRPPRRAHAGPLTRRMRRSTSSCSGTTPSRSLLDLVERPEFLHRMAARLTQCHLEMLDQMEEKGLLGWGQDADPLHGRVHGRAAGAGLRRVEARARRTCGPSACRRSSPVVARPCTRRSSCAYA